MTNELKSWAQNQLDFLRNETILSQSWLSPESFWRIFGLKVGSRELKSFQMAQIIS